MTSKTIFICFLLFSSCRIIESASLSESDSSNYPANHVAVEIDSTSTRGTFNNSGPDDQDLAHVEEAVEVESPEKVEEKAIEFHTEADKADLPAATIEVASAIPDDTVVSKRPTPAVITIPAKEPASKKKFVLAAVLVMILLGAAFLWKGMLKPKTIFDLDREAIDKMDPCSMILPSHFDKAKAELLKSMVKWNQTYNLSENTLDALKTKIANAFSRKRETSLKDVIEVVEKKKYDVESPEDIARLVAARQYYLNAKLIPTLERTNPAILNIARDNLEAVVMRLESTFGVDFLVFKAHLRRLDGVKVQSYPDFRTTLAPLSEAIESKKDHQDYEAAKYFIEHVAEYYAEIFALNNGLQCFQEEFTEFKRSVKLGDKELLSKLNKAHESLDKK